MPGVARPAPRSPWAAMRGRHRSIRPYRDRDRVHASHARVPGPYLLLQAPPQDVLLGKKVQYCPKAEKRTLER